MRDTLDLDRYPLDRPDSEPYAALVEGARATLARDGMLDLPGFLRPEARAEAVAALGPRFDADGFVHARRHTIYFRPTVPGLDPGHPALAQVETRSRTLPADRVGGALDRLHGWPPFAAFLAALMGRPALYPMEDPLARVNVMEYRAGEALNWHFDRSEFTTTILLQAPEGGGLFEVRTGLRSEDDPNFDGVARLLRGEDPQVRQVRLEPGALNLFRGRNAAHRVTPVEGDRPRLVAVFSFFDRPGVRMTPEEQRGFYGRAA